MRIRPPTQRMYDARNYAGTAILRIHAQTQQSVHTWTCTDDTGKQYLDTCTDTTISTHRQTEQSVYTVTSTDNTGKQYLDTCTDTTISTHMDMHR